MTELLMFEVNVKNVKGKERREGKKGISSGLGL